MNRSIFNEYEHYDYHRWTGKFSEILFKLAAPDLNWPKYKKKYCQDLFYYSNYLGPFKQNYVTGTCLVFVTKLYKLLLQLNLHFLSILRLFENLRNCSNVCALKPQPMRKMYSFFSFRFYFNDHNLCSKPTKCCTNANRGVI